METLRRTGAALVALTGILAGSPAWARQDILIGELSVSTDYQERNYKDGGDRGNEGDSRALITTPRMRYSSRGDTDLLAFTYAPSFTYEDVDSHSFVGHDLNLHAEKYITREWLLSANNSYFSGEDSVSDYQRRSEPIIPGQETPPPQSIGASQPTDQPQNLSEVYGRNRYWRNDFDLRTDYTYAQDSIVGAGYSNGILRNTGDEQLGYSDYDRQEWIGRLSYRFDTQWKIESQASYVEGTDNSNSVTSLPGESDDLTEYKGRVRLNYSWRPHDNFFGSYDYHASDYQSSLREDSAIHTFTLGWDHDFSRRLRMTLSGGPTVVTYDHRSNDNGLNSYAGLVYDFKHGSLAASTSYNYEYDNFDGRQTGLTKTWSSEVAYTHRFTPDLQGILSADYVKSDSGTPDAATLIVTQSSDNLSNTEETYTAGATMQYTFLRWYTFSAAYRYADHTEPNDDYNEHRVLMTISVSQELLRW